MKRVFFIFLILLNFPFYIFSNDKLNNRIFIEMSYDEVLSSFGEPENISIDEFTPNHDWDKICYEYSNMNIYMYRVVNSLNQVYLSSSKYILEIDEEEIICGMMKKDIEKLFGNGIFNNYDKKTKNSIYHYEFTNFRELYCFYNEDDELVGLLYGFVDPE